MSRRPGGSAIAAIAAGLLWLTPASPASARTADYGRSEVDMQADAEALEVSSFPPMPERGAFDVILENEAALDHRLRILSIACSVWKVDNPLSQMVARALGQWDRDGRLADATAPMVRLRIDSALSTMRCVEVRE